MPTRAASPKILGVLVCAMACSASPEAEPSRSVPAGSPAPTSTAVAGECAAAPSGEWAAAPVGAATFVVNRATRGMTSRVRWMLSPDSSAIVVMDDPAAVEADAIPNGLLFATERTGRVFRMDSVWSAAPSPDWRRLAVGRAVVLGGGQAQSIPPERWAAPAARLRTLLGPHPALAAESLRAHSFPASGMAVVEGAAVTLVADVATDSAVAPVGFVALDGWRVRWSCDGGDLLVGGKPARVQDDSPSTSERRVSSRGGDTTSARAADAPAWREGPTLDIGTPVARGATTPLRVRGRTIEERGGRIVLREHAAPARDTEREIGAGVPLAATRGGHFILAIAPRTGARAHESPDHAVVYRVP
jgi:hypothetical protein